MEDARLTYKRRHRFFLSIGYVQFFALSTTCGTCSPLTGNPNPFNKQGF